MYVSRDLQGSCDSNSVTLHCSDLRALYVALQLHVYIVDRNVLLSRGGIPPLPKDTLAKILEIMNAKMSNVFALVLQFITSYVVPRIKFI